MLDLLALNYSRETGDLPLPTTDISPKPDFRTLDEFELPSTAEKKRDLKDFVTTLNLDDLLNIGSGGARRRRDHGYMRCSHGVTNIYTKTKNGNRHHYAASPKSRQYADLPRHDRPNP